METFHEIETEEWRSVSGMQLIGLAVFVAYLVWQHFFTDDQWVFLLDNVNLALHEAGHPIIGMLSYDLAVYGGTIFQLVFPLAFAFHFWQRWHALGLALSLVWLGENLLNIGRYMADARARELPLLGGGGHDWTEIFSRWGVLTYDTQIAATTRFVGLLLMLFALIWLWQRWRRSSARPRSLS